MASLWCGAMCCDFYYALSLSSVEYACWLADPPSPSPPPAQVSLFYDQLRGLQDGYAASSEEPVISEFGFMLVNECMTSALTS